MLVRIKSVFGENFRSFQDKFRVDFPEQGLCLVRGINQDSGDSSDSGKSNLVGAISFLLGEAPFAGTEAGTWGAEKWYVGCDIVVGEKSYTIVYKNGLKITEGDAITSRKGKDAKKFINELFGMDEKVRAAVLARHQDQKEGIFLSLSDQERKEFLADVIELDKFEKINKDSAEKVKYLRGRVDSLLAVVASTEKTYNLAKQTLDETPAVPEVDLSHLKRLIEEQKRVGKDLFRQIEAVENEIKEITQAGNDEAAKMRDAAHRKLMSIAEEVDPEEEVRSDLIDKLKTSIQGLVREDQKLQTDLERQKNTLLTQIYTISSKLDSSIQKEVDRRGYEIAKMEEATCPTCSQKWVENQKALKAKKDGLEEALVRLAEQEKLQEAIQDIQKTIDSLPAWSPNPAINKSKADLSILERSHKENEQVFRDRIESEKKTVRARQTALEEAIRQKYAEKLLDRNQLSRSLKEQLAFSQAVIQKCLQDAQLSENIAFLREERNRNLDVATEELDAAILKCTEAKAELAKEEDFALVTGRNGFLGVIFDEVLAEVAQETNNILGAVANTRHLTFEFTTDDNRRIIEQIRNRGEARSFKSGASGGMLSVVKLAVDLAFGAVAARRRGIYPGWLVLDESFDGLGRVAKETVMDMLLTQSNNRLIMVIDHATEFQSMFSQVIDVKSKNGISKIDIG